MPRWRKRERSGFLIRRMWVQIPLGVLMSNKHLGGWSKTELGTWCPLVWKHLVSHYNVQSILDMGCGPGVAIQYFNTICPEVLGIEGDPDATQCSEVASQIVLHDYTTGPYHPPHRFDLGWSAEFVEHVEEKYIDNFLTTFSYCNIIAMTHAVPGQWGYHHVNCQKGEYWITALSKLGFQVLMKESLRLRRMTRATYVASTVLLFLKVNSK